MAYIFSKKHYMDNRASALTTTRGLLRRPKTSWTLVHKRLQIGPSFLSILRKFCILRYCQASRTEISKRNSAKLLNGGQQIALTTHRTKVGVVLPKKNWGQKTIHLFGFSTTSTVNGEYLLIGTRSKDSQLVKSVAKYKGSGTLSANFMNFGPQIA